MHAFWYRLRARALAFNGAFCGAAISLPPVGKRLAAWILREASTKRVLVADLDGTLSPHNGLIPREIAAAMAAAVNRGKTIVLVTSRAAVERIPAGTLLAPESLQSVPPCALPGFIIASSRDGYVVGYDRGEWQTLFREPGYTETEKEALVEAVESGLGNAPTLCALRTNLARLDFSSLTLCAIFVPGSSSKDVLAATKAINEQLVVRGLPFRSSARLVRNERLGHYIEIPKIDKEYLLHKVSQLIGNLRAEDSLIVGDSMAAPQPEPNGVGARFRHGIGVVVGRAIGGQRVVTGSDADRDMERALSGALSVSVGGAADPAMPRGYLLAGGWEEWSARLLAAWAADGVRDQPAGSILSQPRRWIDPMKHVHGRGGTPISAPLRSSSAREGQA
jgi:hypothetical protein